MSDKGLYTTIKVNGHTYEQPTGLFINGEFVKSVEGNKFDVINPSTGKVIVAIEEGREADVDAAVAAARKAFNHGSTWRSAPASYRAILMNKLADLMEKNAELLSSIESLDNGKPMGLSTGDVAAAIGTIRYYGGWSDKIVGQTIDTDPSRFAYTRHEPIGVCGQIIPWNFPILMWAWKIAPALCCGNTVVLKSAEQTPLAALFLCTLVKEAGFPPGVLNIISGFGPKAGAAVSAHMGIDKVAFTGSTAIGRTVMKAAADSNLKKVTLELGGKSPNIVFDDANLEEAISWSHFGIFYNQGQVCCAGSRIFVQDTIYDKFVDLFKEKAKTHQVGDPFAEGTFQGPQVSQLQFDRVMGYIKSGKDEGATVIGGERVGKEGYFIEPTIITNATSKMKVMQEEIFGPVVAISKFHDIEDVIKQAHDTMYGLAAAVHTTDLKRAFEISNRLESGTVWVNCYNALHYQVPFGGYHSSGFGRELGSYALDNYTQVKSVHINLGMPTP